jgi:hypothetical protein
MKSRIRRTKEKKPPEMLSMLSTMANEMDTKLRVRRAANETFYQCWPSKVAKRGVENWNHTSFNHGDFLFYLM